jgi:hypothetical protein
MAEVAAYLPGHELCRYPLFERFFLCCFMTVRAATSWARFP